MKSSALKNTRNLNDTSLLAGILLATASFGYSASTSPSYSSIVTVSENANSFTSSLSGTSLFDFNALATSYETVRDHLKRIYRKLHVRSRTEAVLRYLGAGASEST
jgi:hypothetical protein